MAETVIPATPEQIKQLFRGVTVAIPNEGEIKRILQKPQRPLRIKFGIDPTTPDYHFGYFVVFRKLRLLQELGHRVVLLIGGYTARFGDPTDKTEGRVLRNMGELKETISAFKKQVSLVLDLKKTEIRDNSEWYDKMSAEDLLRLMSKVTIAQMLEREMFKKRIEKNKPIGLHEPVYPLLQGYDSVQIKSDLTIIGTDQLFNENVARPLQEHAGQKPQGILGLELISGTDGAAKMSQSLGNAILLSDSAKEQFGKLMSISDNAAGQYAKMLTDLPLQNITDALSAGGEAARDAKVAIAEDIVTQLHGQEEALRASRSFEKQFVKKDTPTEAEIVTIDAEKIDIKVLLVKTRLADSRTRARRLIEEHGIKVDGEVVTSSLEQVMIPKKGILLSKGKRRIVKVVFKQK